MSIDNLSGQPARLLPRTIEDVLRSWMIRGGGAVLIIACVLTWGAMLTWSANDPSLSLNTSEPARNLFGSPGAMIADFLIHMLGVSVVFSVVPPLVLGLQLALGDAITDHRRRLALFAVATVAIAGGCSALPLTEYWPLELGYGGIIGDFAYSMIAGAIAGVAPRSAGAIAGLLYLAIGFWAFAHAICLDKYNVFNVSFRWFGASSIENTAAREPRPSLAQRLRGIEPAARGGRTVADRELAAHKVQSTTRYAEPEPPAWSMDARLQEFSDGPAGSNDRVEEMPALSVAARFACDNPVVDDHQHQADATGAHHTVLLDDELAMPSDDLPNVLKRARQEVSEILPQKQARGAAGLSLPLFQAGNPPPRAMANAEPAPVHSAPRTAPTVVATGYRRPSLNLLKPQRAAQPSADSSPTVLKGRARMLEDVLSDFRIKGEIRDVRPGPVITLFELEPSRGTKSSRVIALADDVARSMSAVSARIAVVPGRNAIGIELPNTRRETFGLRELIDSQEYLNSNAKLPLVLGKGIGGEAVLADLARMPHLLVAGTTGSGKSVGINSMILSLIYRLGPQECRFLMIDPKMLELSSYNGIPHLLSPVITDPQQAVTALNWAVGEMEERYKRMAELGVRNIEAFNTRVKHAARTGEKLGRTIQTGFDPSTGEAVMEEVSFSAEPLPYIVIVVDEFADLMAVAGKEIESLVQRLAQMARAAGIHMIMATQRPSVDVVTGTIKANFPTRISYRVASRIDSRTILNEQGGEQLLGQGDMLFLGGAGSAQRVHGPFVSDQEVEGVTNSLRSSYPTDYVAQIMKTTDHDPGANGPASAEKPRDLFDQAVEIVLRDQKASTSYLQRRLAIGYNRAADLIDRMEEEGVIGPANHAGRRDILIAS